MWLILAARLAGQGYTVQVQHFALDEGLSHRDVQCIHQDRQGFIWLGTKYGLNRFDGYNFKWFTKEKNGLQSNEINHILEAPDGRLWLFFTGTYLGRTPQSIDIFDPLTEASISFEDAFGARAPFAVTDVKCFGQNERGEPVFVTENKLHVLADGKFKNLPVELGKPKFVAEVHGMPGGEFLLLLGKGGGQNFEVLIIGKHGNTLHQYPHKTAIELSVYHHDREGFKLFDFAVEKYRPTLSMQFFQIDSAGLQSKDTFATEVFSRHTIQWGHPSNHIGKTGKHYWISDANGQVQLLPRKGENTQQPPFQHEHLKYTTDILSDQDGGIWVATQFGLYRFRLQEFQFRKLLFNASGKLFPGRRMVVDDQNQLFVVIENAQGIWKVDLDSMTQKQVFNLPNTRQSLGMDKAGRLLFIWDKKLNYVDPATLQTVKTFDINPHPTIDAWTIHEDKYGKIWFDDRGLGSLRYVFQDSLIDIRDWDQDVQNFQVYQFFEEPSDTTWIATNGGLYTMDIKTGQIHQRFWKGGTGIYHLPFDNVHHLHKDKNGSFWLATAGNGLVNWHPQKGVIQRFTRADGLPSNTLYAVYEDEHSNLWLSTDNGIAAFDKLTKKVRRYSEKDGLSHYEFNRVSHFRDNNGNIYFGSLNGVTAFNPKDFYGDTVRLQTPLVITQFQQFDGKSSELVDKTAELKQTGTITLNPADRFFRLEFALLDFDDKDNIQYAYRIEGQDEDWTYQKENALRMSRLPFGAHTLQIKGQSANGHWSENELSISIVVVQPLYLRTWFLLLVGLVISSLILFFHKWRTFQIKARKKELEQAVEERTLQVQADKQIIELQAKELKSLERFKSRLFANISHELRTPLTLILGPIGSALKSNTLTPRNLGLLQKARQSGQDLLKLISSILDLSKLESGKMLVHPENIHLYSFLRQTVAAFKSHAERLNVSLTFEYNAREELWLEFDREKLKAILHNFLSNALKFTPAGGRVVVKAVDLAHSIRLSVADTGRGIHPNDIPHIFDRFYQASHNTKGESYLPEEGGTGLGLALCKEFADLLDASIWAESPDPESGMGSIFCFQFSKKEVLEAADARRLPAEGMKNGMGSEPATPPAQSSFPAISSAHVLIVEDDYSLREYLETILSPYCQVATAENGQAALDYLSASTLEEGQVRADLILSDLMMPVMDGFQLLEKLKGSDEWRHLPVIILTARADINDKLKALRIGVDDYLLKPFEEEELLVRMENLLKNHRQRLQFSPRTSAGPGAPNSDDTPHPMISAEDLNWLEQLEFVVQKRMDDPGLTADTLADELTVSRRTFFRRVKKLTGLTPHEYLREARLQYAQRMLENHTHSTVKAVALSVGFQATQYFSNLYHQRFGCLPTDYIRH